MKLATATISALALVTADSAAAQDVPKVTITYLGLFERHCIERFTPAPGAVDEIKARLSEFRAVWAAEGPKLLEAAAKLAGHPFQFNETVATLQGCTALPSMSAPLMIEAAPFTQSAGGRDVLAKADSAALARASLPKLAPQPMRKFVYSLWHELMHRYVSDSLAALGPGTTPLLGKYAAENIVTRNHLHLFAIETVLWRQLGRETEIAERVAEKKARRARYYLRAYEIVEKEGAGKFIAEIKPR